MNYEDQLTTILQELQELGLVIKRRNAQILDLDKKLTEARIKRANTSKGSDEYGPADLAVSENLQALRTARAELQPLQVRRANLQSRKKKTEQHVESLKRQVEVQKTVDAQRSVQSGPVGDLRAECAGKEWTVDHGHGAIKDWQLERAYKLAKARRAMLAHRQGMGKTLTSLAWLHFVGAKKVLYLTRRTYADALAVEIGNREPSRVVLPLVSASAQEREYLCRFLKDQSVCTVVANVETWRTDYEETIGDLKSVGFDTVVLDESHIAKNPKGEVAKGLWELASGVENVLLMTGTPIKNRPQELWAQLHALYPSLFPTEGKFRRDYCVQVEQNVWGWAEGGLERLISLISSFVDSAEPKDVGHNIPPPEIIDYPLNFDNHPKQARFYKTMKDRAVAALADGSAVALPNVITQINRLCQATAWPAGIELTAIDPRTFREVKKSVDIFESVKLDAVVEVISDLVESEERVVVFSRFREPLEELGLRLRSSGITVGSLKPGKEAYNKKLVSEFDLKYASKHENPTQVLCTTYSIGGESFNLNAARHLVLLDEFWNEASQGQAIGRINRLNNTVGATVHRFYVEDSIDTWMLEMVEYKKSMVSAFTGGFIVKSLKEHLER